MQRNNLSESAAKTELGVGGGRAGYDGFMLGDEFLPELRGRRGIRKYREMSQNDPIIGSVIHAMTMMLRDTPVHVEPANDTEIARQRAEYVNSLWDDMDHSWDDFISEVLTFLIYGFSLFEVVYKRRDGPNFRSEKKYSRYKDGLIGIRKLASRAQWSIQQFDITDHGEINGVWQDQVFGASEPYLPIRKCLLFRTTSVNNEPAGSSVLRQAYKPYYYLTHLQEIESIAIERELNGIPVARIPSEYLSSDATDSQAAVRRKLEQIARDLKFNEQGYVLLPSDTYPDENGSPTDIKMVDLELIASDGTRNIDIDPVIKRYQHDIARTILAEFVMLGSNERGSYALSKSKVDVFLRALRGYMEAIAGTLNRQLLPRLWELNGFDYDTMPRMIPGDVVGKDLVTLGRYVRSTGLADQLPADDGLNNALREAAELPEKGSNSQVKPNV